MGNGPLPLGLNMVVSSVTSSEGTPITVSLSEASTTGSDEARVDESSVGRVTPKAGASRDAYWRAPGNDSACATAHIAMTAHTHAHRATACFKCIPETPTAFGLAGKQRDGQ